MSWSVSTTLKIEHNPLGWQKTLDDLNLIRASANEDAAAERDEQLKALTGAAFKVIVEEPALKNAEEITLSMSGHANKDHAAAVGGGADEYMQFSIYVKKYKQAEAPPAEYVQ